MAKRGRKPGQTNEAIARASVANGKLGGRPGTALPPELYERIGPCPIESPIKLARWYTAALGLLTDMRLRGLSGVDKLAKEVRSNAGAAGKILPHDIIFAASRVVRDDEDDMAAEVGPEEEPVEPMPAANVVRRGRPARTDS